jgi:hypothetical protein
MAAKNPSSKAIVIDTTSYAGNFERELCAYVTGQYGDCGVGDDIAETATPEIQHISWWTQHIVHEPDEHGTCRPASIWATPGWFNNGMGSHYVDDPANYEEATAAAVQHVKDYNAQHEQHIRQRLADNEFEPEGKPGAWTKEAILRTIAINEDRVRKVAENQHRYPAYLSVAIFVDEFPGEDILEEMKLRAEHFCQNYKTLLRWAQDPIQLTGFRLIEPESTFKPTA